MLLPPPHTVHAKPELLWRRWGHHPPLKVGFIWRLLPPQRRPRNPRISLPQKNISGDDLHLSLFFKTVGCILEMCAFLTQMCGLFWTYVVGCRSSVGVVLFTRNLFMDIREFHLGTAGNRSWWNYVDRVRRRKKMRHLNSLKFYFCNIKAAMEMNYGIFLRKGGRSTGQLNIKWFPCSLAI